MAVRISEMDPFPGVLSDNDLMEMSHYAEGYKTYSITPKNIKDYINLNTNGIFRGAWPSGTDPKDATANECGVWWWSGSGEDLGLPAHITSGILEILSYNRVESSGNAGQDAERMVLLQRLSFGAWSYQRMINRALGVNSVSAWADLANKNGCVIQYGTATTSGGSGEVIFDVPFESTPLVMVQPILGPVISAEDSQIVAFAQIRSATSNGFTYEVFQSNRAAVVQTQTSTETVTEAAGGDSKTTEITTEAVVTRDGWEPSDTAVTWVALLEAGTGKSL